MKVNVFCSGENDVVGSIEVNSGENTLTSANFRRMFVPKSSKYSNGTFKDGHVAKCPRCNASLMLEVIDDWKKEQRDDIRKRMVQAASSLPLPEGRVAVGMKHMTDSLEDIGKMVIILGRTTIKANEGAK